jgi:flavin reductase (DIM6/NTAB) family NADH-FMN oxidoreductase RutF
MEHGELPAAATSGAGSAGVGRDDLRSAMSRFASGVAVVSTVNADGDDVLMTATAMASVSLEPPLVLISVGQGSRMWESLRETDRWAICMLNAEQVQVASRFALPGRVSDRLLLASLPWRRGPATGAVLLDGTLAALECTRYSMTDAGDHTLFVGLVVAVHVPAGATGVPLLHFASRYRELR